MAGGTNPLQTSRQQARALMREEIPRCTGNGRFACPTKHVEYTIDGYDRKPRCAHCNKVHIEVVMGY